MANATDPLAASVHGTDPQNLMEYITRQKIYDSRYWKEECFGLAAVDVLEKATKIKCIGASYGGNAKPTRFLCLTLKLLQIQPPQELLDEFIENEEFKYVRLLGAFMKRLTGRPAEIYELLEPLYVDYRMVRYRDVTEWRLLRIDEMVHSLLHDERVCGIALPRLPSRKTLVDEGYLEEDYVSPLQKAIGSQSLQEYLLGKVRDGSTPAKRLLEERETKRKENEELKRKRERAIETAKQRLRAQSHGPRNDNRKLNGRRSNLLDNPHGGPVEKSRDRIYTDDRRGLTIDHDNQRNEEQPKKRKKEKDYGTLFKVSSKKKAKKEANNSSSKQAEEGSTEYWNEQRAKLGLKPLKE